jgi:hypothetical protein
LRQRSETGGGEVEASDRRQSQTATDELANDAVDTARVKPEPAEEPRTALADILVRLFAHRLDQPKEIGSREIRARLRTSDPDVAAHFLEQARTHYEDLFKRAENIERRASTLQGAIAIAASFSIAGAALLLDVGKIRSDGWRIVLAIALFAVVSMFVWAGLRASFASAHVGRWKVVNWRNLFKQAEKTLAEVRIARAASLLWCANHNAAVTRWKARELRVAANWFGLALLGLLVVAGLLVAYTIEASGNT